MLNYEVLANIYKSRKGHKLDEWREFCKWIEELPYSELICDDGALMTPNEQREMIGLEPIKEYGTAKYANVIKCKDCVNYIKNHENKYNCDGFCMRNKVWTDEDGYCNCGERKEE